MSLSFNTTGLGKVLDALKSNIMKNTHNSSLGIVREISNDTAYVEFIPIIDKNNRTNTLCYNMCPFKLAVNDLVVVIFTDHDFRKNLRQYKNDSTLTQLITQDVLHSIEYGVIITKLDAELPDNKYPVKWSATFNNNQLTQTLTMSDTSELSVTVDIDTTQKVTSVNGKTGEVELTLKDLGDLPSVVLSGSYNDLINKPTVYSKTVENDMLTSVFDNITPQIQKTEPSKDKYSYWYKITEETKNNTIENVIENVKSTTSSAEVLDGTTSYVIEKGE